MKMLKEVGFEVFDAAEGQEAFRLLDAQPSFDVLVLNWNMPIVDGETVLKRIRQDHRFQKLSTLVISAANDPQTIAASRKLGAREFLLKPVSREDLVAALNRVGVISNRTSTSKPVTQPLLSDVSSSPFTLKTTGAIATPVKTPSAKDQAIAPVRVMIVDDSVVVRGILSAIIEHEPGLKVVGSASDGKIALDKLSAANPDVIVLDVEMPNMDGIETLKAIRKLQPRLPVVMFSSLTERGAKATLDAIMLGANDYVLKPGGTYMRDVEAGKDVIRKELLLS